MAGEEDRLTLFLARKFRENNEAKLTVALTNLQLMCEDDPVTAGWIVANAIQSAQYVPATKITSRLAFEILGAAWLATDNGQEEEIFAYRMINGSCFISGEACPEAQGLRLALQGVDHKVLPKLRRFIALAGSEAGTSLSPTIRVAMHACVKVMTGAELRELFK